MLYTNICSLRHKVQHLEWELQLLPETVAICLTETHLGSDIYSGELSIKNFQLFRNDRNIHGGGTAVYIRNDFLANVIPLQSPSDSLLIYISSDIVSLYLLVVYRPPSDNNEFLIPVLLDEVSLLVRKKDLLICGDFNLPNVDWESIVATGNRKIGKPFVSKITELSLDQHIFCATHNKGNILDLVMSNRSFVQNVEVAPPTYSDHSLITVKLALSCQIPDDKNEIKVFVYNQADVKNA